MEFLYFLESLRTPWLDSLMALITELGGETAFLAAALVVYWCMDKRQGIYLLAVGFVGTLSNQFLKITCRIPRPWVRDPNFTIVESARAAATGYAFPSGHSQSSVGTFGAIAACSRNKWVRALSIAVCVLVPFSRMYLGVHTPADVLAGSGMAVALVFLMKPIVFGNDGKNIPALFGVMLLLGAAFLAFMELYPFPADVDPDNLNAALKNSYTLLGSLVGMIAVWYADRKRDFSTEAVWYVQILKTALGLALALAVKEGLKLPLDTLFGGHMIARAIRYTMLVLFAGIVWPMTFPRLAKLGRKDEA